MSRVYDAAKEAVGKEPDAKMISIDVLAADRLEAKEAINNDGNDGTNVDLQDDWLLDQASTGATDGGADGVGVRMKDNGSLIVVRLERLTTILKGVAALPVQRR